MLEEASKKYLIEPKNLARIKYAVEDMAKVATSILDGDRDNYDGADGAREVLGLCSMCDELIEALEKEQRG